MKDRNEPAKKSKDKLVLQLFVSGMSPKSMEAIENIKRLCERYIKNSYILEIIDIYKNPEIASEQHIIFSPSLIKKFPEPKKILIGTLSDGEKVLKALGLSVQ